MPGGAPDTHRSPAVPSGCHRSITPSPERGLEGGSRGLRCPCPRTLRAHAAPCSPCYSSARGSDPGAMSPSRDARPASTRSDPPAPCCSVRLRRSCRKAARLGSSSSRMTAIPDCSQPSLSSVDTRTRRTEACRSISRVSYTHEKKARHNFMAPKANPWVSASVKFIGGMPMTIVPTSLSQSSTSAGASWRAIAVV